MIDYYEILQLHESATLSEIKAAFRRLSKKYHPDVAKDDDAKILYHDIRLAYEVLTNPQQRYAYHEERWLQKATGTFKKEYLPTTAIAIYKSLLELERNIFFGDNKMNNSSYFSNELNSILTEKNIEIINEKNDRELNLKMVEVIIKMIPDLSNDYIAVLQKKINSISVDNTYIVEKKLSTEIKAHRRQTVIKKIMPFFLLWLLFLLLFIIKYYG